MMGFSKLLIFATAVFILVPGCSTTDSGVDAGTLGIPDELGDWERVEA